MRRRVSAVGIDRLVRVGPNAFVRGADWDAAGPRTRYVTRVYARVLRLGAPATASHASAAATATTAARTVVDVAATGDVRAAVALADSALRTGTTRSELESALPASRSSRGRRLAELVVDLADGRAGSPAESLGRVVFRELGLPDPVLQHEFVVDGRRIVVDFWFPEQGVVVEVDGCAKYTQARYLAGRTPEQVFLDEKRRQELLLTVPEVRRMVRVEWRDLHLPEWLAHRLRSSGLPCAVRPGVSAILVAA